MKKAVETNPILKSIVDSLKPSVPTTEQTENGKSDELVDVQSSKSKRALLEIELKKEEEKKLKLEQKVKNVDLTPKQVSSVKKNPQRRDSRGTGGSIASTVTNTPHASKPKNSPYVTGKPPQAKVRCCYYNLGLTLNSLQRRDSSSFVGDTEQIGSSTKGKPQNRIVQRQNAAAVRHLSRIQDARSPRIGEIESEEGNSFYSFVSL
jgi:hypothetical protein